jgi:nucleoid-associated protein YgaU
MTRENKLALVIGFALFLLVGILISDHFSTARAQRSAEFTSNVETVPDSLWEREDLIAVGPNRLPGREPVAPADEELQFDDDPGAGVADPVLSNPPAGIQMGQPGGGRSSLDPAPAPSRQFTYHEVRANETLTAICRQYYGDISLIHELAAYNGLADANSVREGHRLTIPSAESLVRGGTSPAPAPGRESAQPRTQPDQIYTVRDGDNLSEIAQRFLGSARQFQVIFDHNRDVLSSPDALRPGMKLKIPRRAG